MTTAISIFTLTKTDCILNLGQKQFIDSYIGIPLVYLHIIFARFLGFLLRRNHALDVPPVEICFIKLLGFGSVVIASDAIYSIRKEYPGTKISIVCSTSIESGVCSLKLFDEVYVIDDSNFLNVITSSVTVLLKLQRIKHLWTVDLETYSKLTGIFALWTRALNRFGFYFSQVAFRYNLNTHNVYFNTLANVQDNYTEMAKTAGASSVFSFSIPGYKKRNTHQHYSYIAVNNTCSDLSKERKMTASQLSELCEWIIDNTPYHPALLGAPSDRQANLTFIETHCNGEQIRNMAGETDFESLYHFLYHECALTVTIDSAPLHIAHKLNVPTVSVWGPTAPQNYIDTHGADNIHIYLGVHCSPCVHHVKNLPCGGNNFCIKNISVNDITNAVQEIINYNYEH